MIKQVNYKGKWYQVTTNEEKKNEPFCFYCQVDRVKKNGKIGARLSTIDLCFVIYQESEK